MASEHLPQADDASLDQVVSSAPSPVLVEFYSLGCGHCRRMARILEQLAQEYAGRFRFVQLDAIKNGESVARYRIRGVPTMIIFADGQEVDRIVGQLPKEALQARVNRALPAAPSQP